MSNTTTTALVEPTKEDISLFQSLCVLFNTSKTRPPEKERIAYNKFNDMWVSFYNARTAKERLTLNQKKFLMVKEGLKHSRAIKFAVFQH